MRGSVVGFLVAGVGFGVTALSAVAGGVFEQSDWSVHPQAQDFSLARFPADQYTWSRYLEAHPQVNAGDTLTLRQVFVSLGETNDADFRRGARTDLETYGVGDAAYLQLAGGVDLGDGVDGALVIDGTTASNSTDGIAHGVANPFVVTRPLNLTSLTLQNGAVMRPAGVATLPPSAGIGGSVISGGGGVPEGIYYYTVRAKDLSGVEQRIGPEAIVTVPTGGGAVSLAWPPVAQVSGYRVYRATAAGSYNSPSLVCDGSGTTCVDAYTQPLNGAPMADGNARVGGRILVKSRGPIFIDETSTLSVDSAGQPGGAVGSYQGWSFRGDSVVSAAPVFGGGGGQECGGGGGYGGVGLPYAVNRALGGLTYGQAALDVLNLGSGGGAGRWGGGGASGGAIGLWASSIVVNGRLRAVGAWPCYNGMDGGGGSGGGIRLQAGSVTLTPTSNVTVAGGVGPCGSVYCTAGGEPPFRE